MVIKIVIIDDDPDIRELCLRLLQAEGYHVSCAANGQEGLQLVRREIPALVLLDVMLPELDGFEVCKQIQSAPELADVGIIILTVRQGISDVVHGLRIGADDYVGKPFHPHELLARVQAVLRRRVKSVGDLQRIVRSGLEIDVDRHTVLVDGEPVYFTATQFRLLQALASQPGRVLTRQHLIRSAIGERAVVVQRTVDVHIRAIRVKLGSCQRMIETVRGVGYRFADSASESPRKAQHEAQHETQHEAQRLTHGSLGPRVEHLQGGGRNAPAV